MSNYWKKKMDELEEEKKTTSQSYWERKTANFDKEWKTSDIVRNVKKDEEEDDIAPIKSTKEDEDDGLFDFFQKGAFEDGYQFGDVTKNILGTVGDAGLNVVKGIAGIGEGLGDLVTYGIASGMEAGGNTVGANRLRKNASENAIDNLLKPAEDYLDKYSVLGRTSDSIMQGVGQVGTIMATGGLGAAAGLGSTGVTALTTGLMGVSGVGSGMSEAYQGGANDLQAFKHGLNSGAADALSELIFGGLGKSLNAVGFSKGLSSADDLLAKLASSKLKNQAAKNIVEFGIKTGAEGLEEVIAGVAQAYSKYHNYLNEQGMDFADVLKDENLLEQFVVGALTSGVVQAPGLNIANKTGTDFITGRTQNEQAVVDKEVENRIAEAEEDGTKLTAKEKAAIQEQVEKDLEKGYISTDLIEEVVGGDTFKTYKSYLDEETKLQQEFDTLNKMKQGDMTGEQMDRRTELKDLLAEIKEKPKSQQVKTLLDQEVSEGINGSRLMESYNERTRRGQKFEADLTKYDEKQQAVIKKAVESGILNNSNRTHEFVDMVAKISADKGVLFDFTNNEKLKTSAFAVDGKAINGFVTKDGITINMQSAKALNTIVGHEITHVLEGTDLYTELQNVVVEYAKTKGDYQGRFDSLSKLYEAVEGADINAELTADLVGDYLFTDPDFINNLSTNHRNVFQKIYDEVKYLLKVATAGSKEARQLEKVKRAFEKAYREGETARESEEISDSETKYSIREEAPPKNTGVAYKVFFVKDGKLYPPMVANPGGADTPMGVWLNADMGTAAPPSKTGRAQVKAGGKGTQGGGGSLAFRPGWHLGDLPRASQFDRVNPETGKKELFPENFVWAEVEYAKDVDYQEEAMSYGYTDNGKFRHAYAGLPRLPENGYYRYRTNPKPDTVPWVITGAMKVNRLLSDAEVNAILEKNGVPPVHRQGGDVGLDKFGFKEDGTVQYSLSDSDGRQLSPEQQEFFKDSKAVDDKGQLLVLYHGTSEDFTVFDKNRIGQNFQNRGGDLGFYFSPYFDEAAGYAKNAGGKRVESVYLNLTNPLIVEDEGWGSAIDQADVRHNDLMRWAKNGKHDGIIVKSTDYEMEDGTVDAVYIAFNPEQIKRVDNKNPTFSNDIRYSLSAEQQEFFKDSVVRDENGNLKVMYHGTSRGGHTMFDPYGKAKYGLFGLGSYFTDNKAVAESYTKKGKGQNPQVYETYLNIKSPMDMDAAADPKQWQKAFPDADFPDSGTNEQFYRAMEEYFEDNEYVRWEAEEAAMDAIMGMGYDGITHIGGGRFNKADDTRHRVYIAFQPEQIKDVGNQKPTDDPDIRYSLSDDSEGNRLTEEQEKYFRSSKMRDENGNLKVMYHGSKDGGFHVFDKRYSDDHTSFFFVDSNDVASSYSGTSETYAARSFRTAEDFNRFFAEIGTDEYEVKEADGKFHLCEDGDAVAESDTAEGIYEEFRDWSGLGYGDVNYKVYLNLTNPLEVDAGGNEWNEIQIPEEHREKFNKIIFRINHPQKRVDTATTRNFAEYANAQGYDGVIFKNILDVGGYGGKYDPHTVAIAFDGSQVKSVANQNPTTNKDIRYSLSVDNEGRKLSKEQNEFFKDSKARDDEGRLVTVYHGSKNSGFHEFRYSKDIQTGADYGEAYYFTSDSQKASGYSYDVTKDERVAKYKADRDALMRRFLETRSNEDRLAFLNYRYEGKKLSDLIDDETYSTDGGEVKEVYLNLTNPLIVDAGGKYYYQVYQDYFEQARANGNDGIIVKNVIDNPRGEARPIDTYIAFSPSQIKSTSNKKPTANPDIRFSLSEDSEGRKLSDNQAKYFKGSKVVDENGNLKVVYHGSPADFNEFSLEYLGTNGTAEGYGFYFTDKKSIADIYSKGHEGQRSEKPGKLFEVYLDIKKPLSDTEVTMTRAQFKKFLTTLNKQVDADGEPLDVLSNYGDVEWEGINKVLNYAMEIEYDGSDSDVNLVHSIINGTGNMKVVFDVLRKTIGYDGIIVNEASWGGDQTIYIAFHPEQIKNVDNLNPTTNPDIRKSISAEGKKPKPYGKWNVYSKDVLLETAPVREAAAPTVSKMESVPEPAETTEAPAVPVTEEAATAEEIPVVDEADLFPDDLAQVETEIARLEDEKAAVEVELMGLAEAEDFGERFTSLSEKWGELDSRIKAMVGQENERFDSLTDADAPPEMEAPYRPESDPVNVENPFDDRDWYEVSKRNVKAYMYENPEVKPFFQDEALALMSELNDTTRGERFYSEEAFAREGNESAWTGVSRHTSKSIETLLDSWGMSYADIEKGLNAIIEDHGEENIAAAKKIEFMLNDRLLNGYTDFYTNKQIPPNQDYVNLLAEMEITEYSKEAFEQFMASADQYAPPAQAEEIAPVKPEYISTANGQMKLPLYHNPNKVSPAVGEVQTEGDIAPVFEVTARKGVPEGQQAFLEDAGVPQAITRKQLHENIVDNIKATFAENGFDFETVLKNAKNLSTFATVDNTPQRVMEKALGYKAGGILSDITVNQVAQNETRGIQWLNSFTDRKSGLLAKLSKQYGIKPGSKESAAAQMYAEGFYVGKNDVIIKYGDAELAADFPDRVKQAQIKGLAKDKSIRRIYDDTLKAINESRTRNAYPEIPRLDNYFLHFRAMNDTFSRLGLPFNPNDIRAKDLPTDLNGVTADLKPGQPFFASAMHREGKRTDFDLLGGLEQYLTSAKNQIYHIDDIQTLRALRNYIADTYGQANGLSDLDSLSEEEAQERIKEVYGSHLSTFAKFLNEEANVLAGKTVLIDRGVEGIIGRRGITFLDTVNKQVGKNMVGFNVSSSMTNFISVVQAFAKANKFDFVKALSQTAASKLKALGGVTDSFVENNPTIIRRKGAEKFFKTPYEKVSDAGYFLMSAVDNISTEIIVRAKYNELTRKGMDQQKAAFEADKWVSRLMGDRSLGQQPQLYNSKMLGLLTKFQLEVRNQLDSQFYDTIQEAKVSSEHIENRLLRNAKTAAKVGSTFFQLAVLQHVFGKAFESVAGYNPAFDIIEALVAAFGWDDDEEDEDTVLDNIEEGFMVLLEDLPYSSTFTGGRIPISSALPVKQFITGKDQYGNEKSRWETLAEAAPYFVAPGGYGQLKKTVAGLKMFSDEHPIAGSYTDSGNLRFPVEDTLGNRVQAAVFGQWASGNARDYFDNERKALNPKQTQELVDVGISIQDYWKYREGLSGLSTLEQKLFYIDSLNLTTAQKNVLANNLTDRKEPIDMSDFDKFLSLDEFDYANDNPEKYAFFGKIGITYEQYQKADDDTKEAYDWAFKYPAKYQMSKAVSDDYLTFWQYKQELSQIDAKDENGETVNGLRKERVIDYINNLDMDYGQRIILYRSMYNSQADRDDYNSDILDYLNSRDDLSYAEKVTILKELDFTVTDDGDVYWD